MGYGAEPMARDRPTCLRWYGGARPLTGVTAYPAGVALCLVLVATGIPAELARHETRPLTDPHDRSAHWSYLRVRVRMDDQAGDADPYEPASCTSSPGPPDQYRTLLLDPRLPAHRGPHPDHQLAPDRTARLRRRPRPRGQPILHRIRLTTETR
ncbi:hypothetical protein ACNJ7E_39850 [Rhodococcus sp. NM-2]|uniref:hypothetical protein n=1 Tax=Rhodococcus sp. NM-2 TaxID=3401174 RepID=UPI003AAE594A